MTTNREETPMTTAQQELRRHADDLEHDDPGMANALRQVAHRNCDGGEAWDAAYALSLAPEFTGVYPDDVWRIRRYIRYVTLFGGLS
jgi:hypothetical protein